MNIIKKFFFHITGERKFFRIGFWDSLNGLKTVTQTKVVTNFSVAKGEKEEVEIVTYSDNGIVYQENFVYKNGNLVEKTITYFSLSAPT